MQEALGILAPAESLHGSRIIGEAMQRDGLAISGIGRSDPLREGGGSFRMSHVLIFGNGFSVTH